MPVPMRPLFLGPPEAARAAAALVLLLMLAVPLGRAQEDDDFVWVAKSASGAWEEVGDLVAIDPGDLGSARFMHVRRVGRRERVTWHYRAMVSAAMFHEAEFAWSCMSWSHSHGRINHGDCMGDSS